MWQFLKNLPFIRLFRKQAIDTEELKEERWVADFSKPHKARFVPETGPTYESSIGKQGLALALKKGLQFAWVEDPLYRYADLIIEGKIRLEAQGTYGAAGFQFRRADDSSYYSFLLSTKGYFRFDVLFNGTTMPLIGWTEAPDFHSSEGEYNSVRIIALGDKFTFIINDKWAGEIVDDTIPSGKLAFAVVSYEEADPETSTGQGNITGRLQALTVDSRLIEVEAVHLRWNRFIKIDEKARFRLAETFLAMNQPLSALVQIKRIWKTAGAPRSQQELLFAARCAMQLSLYEEAEEYLDHCLEADIDSEESRNALAEKAKLLYLQSRYADLEEHAKGALEIFPQDPLLHTLLGHAYINLGRPDLTAEAYDKALSLDNENALIAQNAGSAYERLGDDKTALERYLLAGRLFLNTENYNDLALVIPRVLDLGSNDPRSHSLAGKYYFAIEDFHRAEKELALADRVGDESGTGETSADAAAGAGGTGGIGASGGPIGLDPAVPYLRALLLIKKDKRKAALALLKRAVELAPDSAIFHFRLAENLFLLHQNPKEKELWDHINRVFELQPDDGWTLNLAAQVALKDGNLDSAKAYLEKAAALLPKEAAVRMNQAELAYLHGNIDNALLLLNDDAVDDPEGLLAHQAGTILYRADRLEEAKAYFAEALKKCPERLDYLIDQANCLINLGLYGEADTLLAKAYDREENEAVLDLIGYIAYKKGEFPRAEAAYRLALERDPDNTSFLSALAWIYITMARWTSAEDCIQKLEHLVAPESVEYESVQELRERLLMGTTRLVQCASCSRNWRVPLEPPAAPPLRLVAEPPDELPAGTCIHCGKTYCIGCAKQSLDASGRFVCPTCGERLKLYDEGLKKLIADWARGASY
ncbi:tetratricopeptide repeat protein [Gracilinema caldarium]|uniref:Tetratricopeptide TPR_1 repeat-containing protein n=1 Tax=Gracilinema caldarium (strain ATCC 51460 / DSM 7334 / H1) TaxID=744872 RepID=F8EYK9_GRAC1|nr:tetratricopeptide repeat protein [Gracilinema caldarium]AEJ18586.1 Tetratricopeptide TPR_1 repeat-containing protein [Gracilinema caldarium DSM 7334]